MIPRTFPSQVDPSTKQTEMIVYFLSSVSGLARWTNYIPVKTVATNATKQGTTDVGGYQQIHILVSITGKSAWTDYVPVYEDASATVPWTTNANGYIPVAASV